MAIRTTGELREFLVQAMQDVRAGKMKPDDASRLTKIAAQVNESFYSEVKIAKTNREAGLAVAVLGHLPIGESGGKE